ncbi:glycerophosphodiester phosphodiesterase [Kineosporia succinea]|uniref:Glycerophosphoryl diester phosphodiesterase n=1 Tax=Kineosporia succinea TaxID=84632 RepID=A0ABT9P0R2_9ACTN|nr:glycerophosphodiester phosphodiesterase family protein [Kineosporia succinea]MDP9826266.1 glycerophosphoryl diester phosphodiesterase [Kineosporia succinea]
MTSLRPQVVAHRGASDTEPEHTLAAYLRALDLGAQALECDVRLTADGHLVCVHDRTVNRTSNGTGIVSTLELAQLEGLDWGSWKKLSRESGDPGDEVPDVVEDSDRSHLLTLRKLLTVIADLDRPVQIAIETKHPTRYGSLVERKLARLLQEFGWDRHTPEKPSPVRMMSFSALAVRRMRALTPTLPLVYLVERRMPMTVIDGQVPAGVAIAPDVEMLARDPRLGERIRARGRELHVWTVDTPEHVRVCLDSGASVIITNKPAETMKTLDSMLVSV